MHFVAELMAEVPCAKLNSIPFWPGAEKGPTLPWYILYLDDMIS